MARPMTQREQVAFNNTKACLSLDQKYNEESYWTTVMAKELEIVLDYIKEIQQEGNHGTETKN